MRLAIVGSRGFEDYNLLKKTMLDYSPKLILCGGAKGADTLGEKWAKENNIPITYFIPKWGELGKKAGILRNIEMSDFSTHVLAFWDGKSKGTAHMIDYSKSKGKSVIVILVG